MPNHNGRIGADGMDGDRFGLSPKGDREKIRMARRLRTETTMTLKWIAAQLKTGTGAHTANRLRAANSTTRKEQDEFELL